MLIGWTKSTSIKLYSTVALTDYQIRFAIHRSSGINSGDDIYIGENCETDYRDIRFTSTSDTLYSYWIESSDSSSATIWVKIPSIAANAYTELVLQYGNGGASTVSSGEATFEFFDDFTTVDSSKWTISGSVTVSGSEITVSGGASSWASIISKTSFSYNYAVRSRLKSAHWGTTTGSEGFGFNAVLCAYFTQTAAAQAQHYAYYSGGWVAKESIPTWSANTYYIAEIARPTSTTYKGTVNDANIVTGSSIPTTTTPVMFELYNNGYSITSDWICVRKYSATEPTKYYPQPLSNWTYKRSHSITSATTLTNYQVKIRVYRSEGTSTGDTVYLGSKCLANYGDIRFVASDNTTELPYWMETNAGTYADFWVKVDSITTDSSIYIYYGNSSATTTSNGNTTFEFFDDFEGTALDTSKWNVADWQGSGGSESVSSGTLQITSVASNKRAVYGKTQYASGILEAHGSYLSPDTGYNWGGAGFANSNTTGYWSELIYTTYKGYRYEIGNSTSGTVTAVSWTSAYFKSVLTGSTVDLYIKNAYPDSWITLLSGQSNTTAFYPALAGYDDKLSGSGNFQIDYIFIRTYAATEPTHGAWSAEQEVASYPLRITIAPTTGTDPLSVTYYLSISDPLDNFTLSYGDGTDYTGNSIASFATTHTYTTPGTYTVWAEGYTEFATHRYYEIPYGIEVSAPAVSAYFTFAQTYNTIQFTGWNDIGNANEFYWTFGNGASSYEQNPTHTYHSPGTYQVTLYESNQYQYDYSQSYVTIAQVLTPPEVYFTPNNLNVINPALPYTVNFTNLSIPAFGCTYNWLIDGTSYTTTDATHSFPSVGMYDVGLTVTNALGSATKTYTDAIRITRKGKTFYEVINYADTPATFHVEVFIEYATNTDTIIQAHIFDESINFVQDEIPDEPGLDEWGMRHFYTSINEWGHRIINTITEWGNRVLYNGSVLDNSPLRKFKAQEFREDAIFSDEWAFGTE